MFILSTENSPGSVDSNGSTQMMPELKKKKAFSGKPTQSRVNKEGKRVLNTLYAPYRTFSESNAPGIKKKDQ
jgi:hypothetical protein